MVAGVVALMLVEAAVLLWWRRRTGGGLPVSSVLCVLAVYGSHRYRMAFLYYRHKYKLPTPGGKFAEPPRVTIQLPIFNEMYVVERLIDSVCRIEYPRDRLEIQVLDDSTDDSAEITGFDLYSRIVLHYWVRNVLPLSSKWWFQRSISTVCRRSRGRSSSTLYGSL